MQTSRIDIAESLNKTPIEDKGSATKKRIRYANSLQKTENPEKTKAPPPRKYRGSWGFFTTCFFIQNMVLYTPMQLYTHAFTSMKPLAKNSLVALLIGIIIIPTAFVMAETPNDTMPYPADLYAQCFDGKDNDGDGKVDLKDKDCPICHDGVDNDGDGYIDIKDPDCPKNTGWRDAAAAVLGWEDAGGLSSGGNIPSGGTIGGGSINSGGSIGSCTRVLNFPRRVRTETGFYYVNDFYCDTNIGGGGSIDTYGKNGNGRISAGGFIGTGGSINGGGTIATGGSIQSGGTIKVGSVTSGGSIGTAGAIQTKSTISSGGTIGVNGNIPTSGAISGGRNIATGGTISSGGSIGVSSSIGTSGNITSGGSIHTNGSLPSGGTVGGGHANAGGAVSSGGQIRSGGYIRSGGSI